MSKLPLHILRLGLGVMFLWIGILIFHSPDAWANFIQPWVIPILPGSPHDVMIGTAFLDMGVGFLLLINVFTWMVAGVATIHLITILIASGINDVTARDIGLLTATLALSLATLPENIRAKLQSLLHVEI